MVAPARARTTLLSIALLAVLSPCPVCDALLNTSIPGYAEVYKPIAYAVVGQQKSGTSTLWNVLTTNPAIKWVGYGKESFHFNGEVPRTTLCDNLVEEYQAQVAMHRLLLNRTDLILGDWSATHFSCSCCPLALKTLNADLKVIVVLRDPVQRALSRFLEQKRSAKMPFHNVVVNITFAEYVAQETSTLDACVARAAPLRRPSPSQGTGTGSFLEEEPLLGWGAGLDVGRWMEMQCFSRSNIIGWSVYDMFLENYLAHFPQQQVLVLYTDDLASQPLESIRKVEAFLGAPPHAYDPRMVEMVYNSRECYHWRCARKKNEIQSQADIASGGGGEDQQFPRDDVFAQALSRLAKLYRPHMRRLFTWADQGRIAPPPETWRRMYG